MSEIEIFYDAGKRKISNDKEQLLLEIEVVRTRLEVVARENVEKYRKGCEEAGRQVEDSFRGIIQPFWRRIITTGVRDKVVNAGYERFS